MRKSKRRQFAVRKLKPAGNVVATGERIHFDGNSAEIAGNEAGNASEESAGNAGSESAGNAGNGAGRAGEENSGVRVLLMSNDVQIDDAQLMAQADAALAGAPVDPSAVPLDAQPIPENWLPLIEGLAPMLRIGVFPQWNITDDEQKEFVESAAQSLDLIFPGGLGGKYAPLVRLIACCGGICAVRYIQFGKIPPLGPKRVEKPKQPAADDSQRAAA